jgi:hypothetical protein
MVPSTSLGVGFVDSVYPVVAEIGLVSGYNLASLVAFLTRGVHLLDQLKRTDRELGIRVRGPAEEIGALREPLGFLDTDKPGELEGLVVKAYSGRGSGSWLVELEDALARAEAVRAQAVFTGAELTSVCTNLDLALAKVGETLQPLGQFAERSRRIESQSKAVLGRVESRLVDAQQARVISERRVTKRVIETESGIAGLLAGVGSSLAVVQLGVSPWWSYAAFWVVLAAAVIWIRTDRHYKRLHAIPLGMAGGGLLAAGATWLWSDPLVPLGVVVVGSFISYFVAECLLRWVGKDLRDREKDGVIWRVSGYFLAPAGGGADQRSKQSGAAKRPNAVFCLSEVSQLESTTADKHEGE